jgi:hypothetical protein
VLTEVDDRLREEAGRFELRFTCETCAHFDPITENCASGYPNDAHRRVRLASVSTLSFCKEYELA